MNDQKCKYRYESTICLLKSFYYGRALRIPDDYCAKKCDPHNDRIKREMIAKVHGYEIVRLPIAKRIERKLKKGKIRGVSRVVYSRRRLPPMYRMALNLTRTALRVVGVGIRSRRFRACAEQAQRRFMICRTCPQIELIDQRWRCVDDGKNKGCGCYLAEKVKWYASRCERGRWDTVDRDYEI